MEDINNGATGDIAMTLNVNRYREILRKQLVESDTVPTLQTIPTIKPVAHSNSGVLDSLREKLFGPKDCNSTDTECINASPAVAGVATEDAYKDSPETLHEPVAIGAESDEATLTADDLNDLATDTLAEVLMTIKELRDNVKKEDPKKAALIRRIYDHLLRGKDKITAEILKSHNEEKESQKVTPVSPE